MRRRALVIMVKEPVAGRVKTRLAQDIGTIPATWWYRHQIRRLQRRLQDPRWDCILAVTPDKAARRSAEFRAHQSRLPQGSGDLGQRMARLFRSVSSGPVCIVGSDIPDLSRKHIQAAFEALGKADAVLGPATDGGYWLIGIRHPGKIPAGIFRSVRWSSEHALSDTISSLEPLRHQFVDTLRDVDRGRDLGAEFSARRRKFDMLPPQP